MGFLCDITNRLAVDEKKNKNGIVILSGIFVWMLVGQIPPVFGQLPEPAESHSPLLQQELIHHHPVTTSIPRAQQYFDRGLILYLAFNYEEAIRSFREVTSLDPNCAMAYWGIALASGPNINRPMPAEAAPKLQHARDLAAHVSEKEQAYIEALSKRYAREVRPDRTALDLAYSNAMDTVMQRFSDDLDAATLYAESLMMTMPWNYWTEDLQPKDATIKTMATLESVLRHDSAHIGANHFYIHIVEAGPQPEQGLSSANQLRNIADRLPDLVPGTGHLVHMPGHIYLRVGMYNSASRTNTRAIKADEAYLKNAKTPSYYARPYYPHKSHYLAYTAMMEGRSEPSLTLARYIAPQVEDDFPVAERLRALPFFVMARFGLWEEILAIPAQETDRLFLTAMWHYVRGLAYVAHDQVQDARAETDRVNNNAHHAEVQSFAVPFFYKKTQIHIAQEILEAELAGLQNREDAMIRHFERAVAFQDELPSMEPPYWYYPVRESLGFAHLKRGHAAQAEAVFREDLRQNPWNGRSLNGLAYSLRAQDRDAEAEAVQNQVDRA